MHLVQCVHADISREIGDTRQEVRRTQRSRGPAGGGARRGLRQQPTKVHVDGSGPLGQGWAKVMQAISCSAGGREQGSSPEESDLERVFASRDAATSF